MGFAGGYRVSEDGDAVNPSERRPYGGPRGGGDFRGGRRGGFSNGETLDGSGRGNWGARSAVAASSPCCGSAAVTRSSFKATLLQFAAAFPSPPLPLPLPSPLQ
ncbi:unnamed protein product [Fraxinus pennsylvanica]|uniref:Uncharacterized protein n=1 Tax=Fraxinus pennsylvanica TaxID=56036 RepID=A0AAD1YWC9_9LAMI|nr:unnamed protein product [Fraxinus pennsylvanica]